MSMMGIKGMDFLDDIWDISDSISCLCEKRDEFSVSQDVLGEMKCEKCNKVLIPQKQVDILENMGVVSTPKMSHKECAILKRRD